MKTEKQSMKLSKIIAIIIGCLLLSTIFSHAVSADVNSKILERINNLKKQNCDPFESEQECKERYHKELQENVDAFNQAFAQQNSDYQVGVVYLDKDFYNSETEKFLLRLDLNELGKQLTANTQGFISIPRQDAKKLWEESQQRALPVYIQLQIIDEAVQVQFCLADIEKTWEIFPDWGVLDILYSDSEERLIEFALSHKEDIIVVPDGTLVNTLTKETQATFANKNYRSCSFSPPSDQMIACAYGYASYKAYQACRWWAQSVDG